MEICCRISIAECPRTDELHQGLRVPPGSLCTHEGRDIPQTENCQLKQLSDNIASDPHTRREAVEMGPTE